MKFDFVARGLSHLTLAALMLAAPAALFAAKAETGPVKSKPDGEVVELFAGIKSGDIEVTFIPKDAKEATVLFKNKTDKPVAIRLPEAFAGVPVLAQFGGPGGIAGGAPGGGLGVGGGGGMQGMGGGFGGMGMGGGMGGMMGGMGGFGGFMNVAPDKVGKVKVKTVCLEHGKNDPNPRAKYEIRPIESFTQDAGVIEVCKMVGRGEISQNAAQAAAWNLANKLPFEFLATKNRLESLNGYTEKFFSPKELQIAMVAVLEASKRGEALKAKLASEKAKSPGENQ